MTETATDVVIPLSKGKLLRISSASALSLNFDRLVQMLTAAFEKYKERTVPALDLAEAAKQA